MAGSFASPNCAPMSTWVDANTSSITLRFRSDSSTSDSGVDATAQCVSRSRATTLKAGKLGWTGHTIGGQNKCFRPSMEQPYSETSQLDFNGEVNTAQAKCTALGGDLPVPRSDKENQDYIDVIQAYGLDTAFLGITDLNSDGVWLDSSGASVTYTPWCNPLVIGSCSTAHPLDGFPYARITPIDNAYWLSLPAYSWDNIICTTDA